MAGYCDAGCCGSNGKLITILSIDGACGGLGRGIIPGKILQFLESELKRLDGNNAKISAYFDMIAGTGTGGLIAALLATPEPSDASGKKPVRAANGIGGLYLYECPRIFSNEENTQENSLLGFIWRILGPKYKGSVLHELIRDLLGKRKIGQTLTNVLITSFDIKFMQPTIFSTLRARANEVDNVFMSDVCISTTAAPTYFPPYYFKNTTPSGEKEFNLADGGLAANNPTLLAVGEMAKESKRESISCKNCSKAKYLVLSLGTGEVKKEGKLAVKQRGWGLLDWLSSDWSTKLSAGACPLIESFSNAASDMVDIYTAMYFQGHKDNYLRIQCDNLESSQAVMDNGNRESLEKLVKIVEELLKKSVASVDLMTGQYRPVSTKVTNHEALTKFAKRLSEERRRRLEKNTSSYG